MLIADLLMFSEVCYSYSKRVIIITTYVFDVTVWLANRNKITTLLKIMPYDNANFANLILSSLI